MNQSSECTWHPAVRWVAFFPSGILATGIVQALLRWANSETPFLAEILSRSAEPWAFFLVSLWVLPRYNRIFLFACAALYIGIYTSTIYLTAAIEKFSSQPWADYSISGVAIFSCGAAVYYFGALYSPVENGRT